VLYGGSFAHCRISCDGQLRGISQSSGNFAQHNTGEGLQILLRRTNFKNFEAWDGGTDVAPFDRIMNDTTYPLNAAQASVEKHNREKANVTPWHAVEGSLVTRLLGVDPIRGLTASDVANRRLAYGPNNADGTGSLRNTSMLVVLFLSIAVGFVLIAAILNGVSGNNIEAFSLLAVIVIGSVVGFAYLLKAARALDTLHNAAETCAHVRRDGKQMEVAAEQLVPGDIVILQAGESVPADARLIEAAQLQVQETALTGKNTLVEKGPSPASNDAPLEARQSMVYFGTALNSGSGVAVVVATGSRTELGRIAACDS